jgi:hypothetical protein
MEGQRLPLPHLPARLSSETVVLMTVQRFALDTSLNDSEMAAELQTGCLNRLRKKSEWTAKGRNLGDAKPSTNLRESILGHPGAIHFSLLSGN